MTDKKVTDKLIETFTNNTCKFCGKIIPQSRREFCSYTCMYRFYDKEYQKKKKNERKQKIQ
jgi:predicted nucleic acid-binding Zn ribbon protein